MNLERVHNVYFIGIGGIGMSALARYFNAEGKRVSGYDKTPSDITRSLLENGVSVHYDDDVNSIEDSFKNKDNTLIVYTPAIPKNHTELNYFLNNEFVVMKRAAVLGLITKNSYCFAVAGTHGKTTTSSILGHLLKVCNANMTAFLGGITENYKSNLILNGSKMSVVEADEFDRSFLQLSPDAACVTSMDADHLDIYGEEDALHESFRLFADKVSDKNKLFVKNGLPLNGTTYGINDDADYSINNINIQDGSYVFSIKTPEEIIDNVRFHFPGEHNLLNALVAFAMAYDHGFNAVELKEGLDSFKGVQRRFTYQIKSNELIYIDDYAHHPTEINAIHQAVREMYSNEKVLVVFQPHLFSRTKDFADDFARSLEKFDSVRLIDIYPARELPIEGVTSQWLLDKMNHGDKKLIEKEQISKEMLESGARILITLGAGDIGVEVPKIKQKLSNETALG